MKLPVIYEEIPPHEVRYVRAEYVRLQKGKCYHCKESLAGPPLPAVEAKPIDWSHFPRGQGFLRWPVHLHHNKETGLTIGAVHAYCNAVLFQYHKE